MDQRPENPLSEARSAMVGVVRLFLNDARGLDYFRLDLAGLMTSFVGLVVSWILFLYVPPLLGIVMEEGTQVSLIRTLLSQVALYSGVALFAKIIKQPGGFLPYLIAHNWASLFIMPFQIAVLLAGNSFEFFFLAGVTAFSLVFFLRTTQILFKANFIQILMLIGILTGTLILMVSFTGLEFWGIPLE